MAVTDLAEQQKVLKNLMDNFEAKFNKAVDIYGVVKVIEHNLSDREGEYVAQSFKNRNYHDLVVLHGIARTEWKKQALQNLQHNIDKAYFGQADKMVHEMRTEDLLSAGELQTHLNEIKAAYDKHKAEWDAKEATKIEETSEGSRMATKEEMAEVTTAKVAAKSMPSDAKRRAGLKKKRVVKKAAVTKQVTGTVQTSV